MRHLFALALFLALLTTGCAGDGAKDLVESEVTLDQALTQLDSLPTPAGVSVSSFDGLKDSLAVALRASGKTRFASMAPGVSSAVNDLALTLDGGSLRLDWTYRNKGDYDQNKQVTISDLTPLGANLMKSTAAPDWLTRARSADGDANGEINISDITPIGANLFATVEGYRVQTTATPTPESSWVEVGGVGFGLSQIVPGQALRTFSHDLLTPVTGNWYRVVPYAGSQLGSPSNAVQFSLAAPEIVSVSPTEGEAATVLTFTPVLTGGTPTSRSWNFGGGATPNTSTQLAPSVTLGPAGTYNASLTVSNAAGSDVYGFTLTVVNPEPPIVDGVSPLTANAGQQLNMVASLSGGAVNDYSWDFGGGATPGTSSDVSPVITLGPIGSYACSVTVSNSGGSDTFQFTMNVVKLLPPQVSVELCICGTGLQMTIVATVTGGTPDTFAWDFGGGATPNTSSDISPTITCGAPGTYGSSVTVSNAAGSDTCNFDLYSVPLGAIAYVKADPLYGDPWDVSHLDGSLSWSPGQTIVKYEWDLGDDGTYEIDSAATPTVDIPFPDPPGPLFIKMRVTDDVGSQSTDKIQIHSDNQWPTCRCGLHPKFGAPGGTFTADGYNCYDLDGTIVKYEWDLDHDGTYEVDTGAVNFYQGVMPDPPGAFYVGLRVTDDDGASSTASSRYVTSLNGWYAVKLNDAAADVETHSPTLTVVDGKPYVVYWGINGMRYVKADDIHGQTWQPTQPCYEDGQKFDHYNYFFMTTMDGIPALMGLNGRLDWDDPNARLAFMRAGNVQGTDWQPIADVPTGDDVGDLNLHYGLAIVDGHPAQAFDSPFGFPDSFKVSYIRASDQLGAAWGSVQEIAVTDKPSEPMLAVVGGNPAVTFTSGVGLLANPLMYVRALDAQGETWGTVQPVDSQIAFNGSAQLIDIGGKPAICYERWTGTAHEMGFSYASSADGSGAWTSVDIDTGQAHYTNSLLHVINGKPAVIYALADTNGFAYRQANDAQGTSWGMQDIPCTGVGVDLWDFRDIAGKPAIVTEDVQEVWYLTKL